MTFSISEAHVQRAFNILHSSDHATSRAAYEFSEKHLKVVLAQEAAKSNATSIAQRESDAYRSEAYIQALGDFKLVAEAYHRAKDQKDASLAVIDGFRTQSADARAMSRIG